MDRSARTAIHRTELPTPIRRLINSGYIDWARHGGHILDYGSGHGSVKRGLGPMGFNITNYDPNFAPQRPRGQFDVVLLVYVLNVVNAVNRHTILADITKVLTKPNAMVFVAVRSDGEISKVAKTGRWTRSGDGWITGSGTFQKGFSKTELISIMSRFGFVPHAHMGAGMNAILFKRVGGALPRQGNPSGGISRANPATMDGRQTADLYEAFHEKPSQKTRKVNFHAPAPGEKIIALGKLSTINYVPYGSSGHKGIEFTHAAGDVGSKKISSNTILAASADGKQLYLIKENPGSKYPVFTNRGIIG